jgi:hypothetical protein
MIYFGKSFLAFCLSQLLITCLIASSVLAQTKKPLKDSVNHRIFVVTPRINSSGHFPFSGALLNKNANVDLNIFYERNGYGFFIFQSIDMEDKRSFVNYLQPGVFKKFKISESVKLGLFAGYIFSQTNGFRDENSDYYAAPIIYWTIRPKLKFESTSLFFDFNHSTKLANRFLMSYTLKGFRFDSYVWYRAVFEQNTHAVSVSLALVTPKAKLMDNLHIQTSLSYWTYVTDTKPDFALRDGFLFSLEFPLSL